MKGVYILPATRQEFPRTIPHAALRPGESVKWTDESEVMVCNWKDKRDVYLIASNDAGGDVVKHVRRKHHDVDLAVPTCIQVNGWCRPARSDAGLLRGGMYWSSLVEISILGSHRRRPYQIASRPSPFGIGFNIKVMTGPCGHYRNLGHSFWLVHSGRSGRS